MTTITHDNQDFTLTAEATRTNRVFAGSWSATLAEGDTYIDEFSATATDGTGGTVVITWQFFQVVGEEVADDCLDWDQPYSVIYT